MELIIPEIPLASIIQQKLAILDFTAIPFFVYWRPYFMPSVMRILR